MTVIEATTMAVGTIEGMMIGVMTAVTMIDGMTAIVIVTIGTTDPFRLYL